MQLSESRLYAPHRFADIVVACGVAHAEALGIAEGIASYCSHMSYLKQVHGEVGRAVDGACAIGLAVEA